MAENTFALIQGRKNVYLTLKPHLEKIYGSNFVFDHITSAGKLDAALKSSRYSHYFVSAGSGESRDLTLLKCLKERTLDVPVILVFEGFSPDAVKIGVDSGADDYIVLQHVDERLLDKAIRYSSEKARSRAAEHDLTESEIRFKTLIEGLGEGIIFADADDKIIHINSRFGQMSGHKPWDIIGKHAYKLLLPPDEQKLLQERTRRRLAGISESYEIQLMKKDGSRFWAEINATPVFDANGKVIGTLGAVTDISNRKKVQDALQISEKKYRDLVEMSSDLIWSLDSEGQFVFVNQAAVRIYGYEPEEMLKKPIFTFSSSAHASLDKKVFNNVLNGHTYFQYETEHRRKDGSIVCLSFNATPRKDDHGNVIGIAGTATDISERKKTERALRKSEQRFRSYFHLPLVGFAIVSPNKEWIDINEKLCQMLGYTREELMSLSWVDITHPEDLDKDLDLASRVMRGEIDNYSLDKRYLKKSGEILYITISVGCVRKTNGEVDYFVVLVQEISDRVKMQQELRHQKQYLRQVIDTSSNLIFARDAGGRLTLVNESTAQLFGTTVEDMLGKTSAELGLAYAPENGRPPGDILGDDEEVIETGRSSTIREHVIYDRRHNRRRIYQMAKTILKRGDDSSNQVLSVATDITERKIAEEETYELQRQLMQSQKMEAIGQLAAGIAHDLNNALGAVVGHLQLMKITSCNQDDNLTRSVDVALNGCERASSLIEQLLGFSRQGRYNLKRICLQEIVDDTISFLSKILEKNIRIEKINYAKKLYVEADAGQLQQALTNLIINARQAMPEGGSIVFEFSSCHIDAPKNFNPKAKRGDFIKLVVKDSGVGIPTELLDKIFEPFFSTKGERGTGLGLAMVYGTMQSHGGWVEVRSSPNGGSRFSLYFPQVQAGLQIEKEVVKETSARPISGTVLVVDDEPHLVDLAKAFLNQRGFNAKGFTSGKAAMDWYRKHAGKVDLVILDMKMPDMDGKACFQHIKQINSRAKVVILTGYVQDDAAQDLINAGVLKFFQKPLKYPDLMNWISDNVGKKEPLSRVV